jgi:hypothetical protein
LTKQPGCLTVARPAALRASWCLIYTQACGSRRLARAQKPVVCKLLAVLSQDPRVHSPSSALPKEALPAERVADQPVDARPAQKQPRHSAGMVKTALGPDDLGLTVDIHSKEEVAVGPRAHTYVF